ncbi:hypothetical protein P5673_021238 [Acropora cervicornis]|uniref:Uncharacterized protein n=1 Tax=Acropora cervicornis TaxID=6130 RepID=A0AAD9Q8I5_ACRCE|nr:hypothetical protein P5673_021238 [Acropora cervicornis]
MEMMKRRLEGESRARATADSRILEVGSTLSQRAKTILEDDRVLESIEASFRQFHDFLDLLKGSSTIKNCHPSRKSPPTA